MSQSLQDFFSNELFANVQFLPTIHDDNARMPHQTPELCCDKNDNSNDIDSTQEELTLQCVAFENNDD